MAANGKLAKSSLKALPARWSNKGKVEHLRSDAADSLSRAMSRAVADTGANFQVWSAYRSYDDQVAMLKQNYTKTRYKGKANSSDRIFQGVRWVKKSGRPNTATPGLSNHGNGLAVDIHHGPIQEWMKSKGRSYGWDWSEGRRNGENWHFVYSPSRDSFKSEGYLDHAAVQKIVGADVDGKIGTGTVKAIKAWQKANGLEADGKVGPATKAKMGLSGKGGSAPVSTPSAPAPGKSDGATVTIGDLPDVESGKASPNKHTGRVDPRDGKSYGIKHITVHWWGLPSGQAFDGIVNHLCNKSAQVSAHYVISPTRVAQIVDEKDSSWANGNRVANFESITIECDPNDVLGTLPVLAALIKDIRGRHGDLPIFPHQHWTSTQCPGDYLPHLDAVDQMARAGKAVVTPGKPASKPSPSKGAGKLKVDGRMGTKSSKALQRFLNSRVKTRKLAVDGRLGPESYRSLQEYLGSTPVDGAISHQSYKHTELGNGISPNGWRYTGRGSKGSKVVEKLQKWVGVGQDGVWYEGTTAALQRKLNEHGVGV